MIGTDTGNNATIKIKDISKSRNLFIYSFIYPTFETYFSASADVKKDEAILLL